MQKDVPSQVPTPPRSLEYYKWGLAAGWTLIILVLLGVNLYHERAQAIETARTQARSNYERDVLYRHWNARYGRIYVPVSEKMQPNPHLADLPERDVVTDRGLKLTLVNPSYMSRLALDMASRTNGVKGHITSLRPLRPENVPDPWETAALMAFSNGKSEASSVEEMEGRSYLRLIKPLVTEKECLECHGRQGYRVGDIRGGLSVAVPMAPLWALAVRSFVQNAIGILVLWLLGLSGIFVGSRNLRRAMQARDEAERGVRALNRDLMSRTEELENANRELDAFCATVSHDLRSPLTAISGYCYLLRETFPETGSEMRVYTDIMLNSATKMENLIDTLLDFSRVKHEQLARSEVDLAAMAREIASELRMLQPERDAVFAIPDSLTVQADPSLLLVVLQNLLGNAWKYTRESRQALIELGFVEEGGKPLYFVRDNGIGFDDSMADQMFEAFRRLPNAVQFQGTGVGLATVRRIVDRHGGTIRCQGTPGEGATFYFSLC